MRGEGERARKKERERERARAHARMHAGERVSIGICLLIVVSNDPLYFCVVCRDYSIFISSFIDLILP